MNLLSLKISAIIYTICFTFSNIYAEDFTDDSMVNKIYVTSDSIYITPDLIFVYLEAVLSYRYLQLPLIQMAFILKKSRLVESIYVLRAIKAITQIIRSLNVHTTLKKNQEDNSTGL